MPGMWTQGETSYEILRGLRVGNGGGKMTREEAIKILEMFLHKDCSLERTKFAYDENTVWHAVDMAYKSLEAWKIVDRELHDLGVRDAYDMPSFWCHDGKDYKVIPTKYHKGYQQAICDVAEIIEKHLKEVEE